MSGKCPDLERLICNYILLEKKEGLKVLETFEHLQTKTYQDKYYEVIFIKTVAFILEFNSNNFDSFAILCVCRQKFN